MRKWAIACDFDGTIANDDVVDALLERFGRAGWKRLELDWQKGHVGALECMRDQVALLDMDHGQLDGFLDGRSIDPAFPDFVAVAQELDVPIFIASDGMDYTIHSILARHGLDALPVVSNHLQQVSARSWRLAFPHRDAMCASGTCKCGAMERARNTGRHVLLIGDGASDFCAAARADFVFAKSKLMDYCRTHDIVHLPIADFDDARELLPRLLAGGIADDARTRVTAVAS